MRLVRLIVSDLPRGDADEKLAALDEARVMDREPRFKENRPSLLL